MNNFDEAIINRLKTLEREVKLLQTVEKSGAWTSYTPVWTASTTNPVLGNGTLTGKYVKTGKTVIGDILLAMGSTTTYGSGAWSLSLPFVCASGSVRFGGSWAAIDVGTINYAGSVFVSPGASTLIFFARDGGNNFLSSTSPYAWGSGDALYLSFAYETV